MWTTRSCATTASWLHAVPAALRRGEPQHQSWTRSPNYKMSSTQLSVVTPENSWVRAGVRAVSPPSVCRRPRDALRETRMHMTDPGGRPEPACPTSGTAGPPRWVKVMGAITLVVVVLLVALFLHPWSGLGRPRPGSTLDAGQWRGAH